jgi:hypothetical protein
MSAVGDALAALRDVLDGAAVPWFLFGAQAIAVRAAPRATQDVDVTIDASRHPLTALVPRLEAAGIFQRYPELAERLLRTSAVVPMIHRATGMEIDIVIAGSGLEQCALAAATRVEIDGVTVPVASSTHLAVMKTLAGRGKDLDDLRALLASGTVDVTEARDLLRQLEGALDQSDLLPVFELAAADVGPGR